MNYEYPDYTKGTWLAKAVRSKTNTLTRRERIKLFEYGFAWMLLCHALAAGQTNNAPLLERAVKSGKHVHEVAPHAAKPGERPNDYGSPGREKHDKGPPPGKGHEKKP